jgi:hypothetical protein
LCARIAGFAKRWYSKRERRIFMKKTFVLYIAAFLVFASCGDWSYPVFRYTNTSGKDISFRTAEPDSPWYELKAGTVRYLDSGVRGRGEIASLRPPYVVRDSSVNIYDIVFVPDPKAPKLSLEAGNSIGKDLVLIEENGYLEPEKVFLDAASDAPGKINLTLTGVTEVNVYTKKPSFKLMKQKENAQNEFVKYDEPYTINTTMAQSKITVTIE